MAALSEEALARMTLSSAMKLQLLQGISRKSQIVSILTTMGLPYKVG
jgi:hypothetical protein